MTIILPILNSTNEKDEESSIIISIDIISSSAARVTSLMDDFVFSFSLISFILFNRNKIY